MVDLDLHAVLGAAGTALFGEHWQRPLARALGCDDRRVRRWASDPTLIPPEAWTAIAELLRMRARQLDDEYRAVGHALAGVEHMNERE